MDPKFIVTAALAFALIVGTLVILHEFAHFTAAKAMGITPKVFSVGMGPEIAGVTDKHGTRWKLSVLPVGGYVKFRGAMHPSSSNDVEPEDFASLPRWKRSLIVGAGPAMNFIIALVIITTMALTFGYVDIDPKISKVEENSPAAMAGIKPGDEIIAWNGEKSPHMRTMMRTMLINPGSVQNIEIRRDDQIYDMNIKVTEKTIEDESGNTSVIGYTGMMFEPRRQAVDSFDKLIDSSIFETMALFSLQAETSFQILTGERSVEDLRGPVRMAKMSGEQMLLGWRQAAYFAALVSLAIAFMNILPIPGLDGGYLALYAFEGLKGSDVTDRYLQGLMIGGYVILAIIMGTAIFNDAQFIFGVLEN